VFADDDAQHVRTTIFRLASGIENADNTEAMTSLSGHRYGMAVRPGLVDPLTTTRDETAHEEPYAVYLHNDNVNAMEYVVASLIDVFGHPRSVATQVMMEAHFRGVALAEVESKDQALKHNRQLGNLGLTSSVERMQ
jgi:ATP-dependent Clp protease adapter protein ClpS